MRNGRAVLLVLIGVAIIAAGAYFLGLFNSSQMAVAPPANIAETAPKGERSATTEPAMSPEGKNAEKESISTPAFDVVRVEPSGDMVIAGTAEPDSAVEIVTGSNVIAEAKADSGGNFAAVLDKPLKPGDYQIVLRATAPDGTVATSTQTAVVSIPAEKSGQVLALVEQPGEPSRLITKPDAKEDAGNGGQDEPGAQTGQAEQGAAGGSAAQNGAATPASPEPDGQQKSAGNEIASNGNTAGGAAAGSSDQMASTDSKAPAGREAGESQYSVSVEAVEIDGTKIFIAGKGTPGLPVMIYANDSLLGQVKVNPAGRFLLETERDLPVGDYIIRADMLDETGAKVLARAAVPFEREAGQSVAAVAPSAGGAEADGQSGTIEHSDMGDQLANTPPTIVGEKLSNVKSSVIIRRGDNLWRISRRVYGRGIRYTTIYLANKDQIRDPDLIWPGQVFTVPRQTPEGEKADTTLMENRWAEQEKKKAGDQ